MKPEIPKQEQKKKDLTPEGLKIFIGINNIRALESRLALIENPKDRAALELEQEIEGKTEQLVNEIPPGKRGEVERVLARIQVKRQANREKRAAQFKTISETQEPEQKSPTAPDTEEPEFDFNDLKEAVSTTETNGPPPTPKQETLDDFDMSDLEETLKK